MTLRFRAAVLSEAGRKLRIETVEAEQPRAGEVLVRIAAAGLCHTDLEVIQGQLVYPMPIVLGHEAAGIIAAVGPGVDPGRVGERVVLSWNPHCGRCFHCERGQPILCDKYVSQGARAVAFDGTTRLSLGGQPVQTMMHIAAFAEYAVVTDACAVAIPPDMPLDCACLLGCAVLTGVGAATRIAGLRYGETAMVIGCGAVGLSAVQGARLAGASQIIAVDLDDAKLAMAQGFGSNPCGQRPRGRSRRGSPSDHRRARCRLRAGSSGERSIVPLLDRGLSPGRADRLARQGGREPGGLVSLGCADGRETNHSLQLRRRADRNGFSGAGALLPARRPEAQ